MQDFMRDFVERCRAEPLRMTILGILFTVTMVAAVVVPRQIGVALKLPTAMDTSVVAETPT
jgi:hypothetical protein